MKNVKIFLASSIEDLKDDRIAVGDYFRQLNDIYVKRNIYFELVKCEDYDNSIQADGMQSAFDKEIRESELCFFLFFRKAGDYTKHEFEVAAEAFKDCKKPRIVTYFKDVAEGESVADEVKAFMSMLDGEFKHYYNTYGHIDTLKLGIIMQIKLMKLDTTEIKIEDGEVKLGGETIVKSENVPILNGNENLRRLTERKKELQEKARKCEDAFFENRCDENRKAYSEALSELDTVSKQLTELEKEMLELMTTVAEMTTDGRVLTYRQKEALRYFNEGDCDKAQQILDDEERENELERAENKAESAKNEIQGYIEEDLLWIKVEKTRGITKENAERIIEKYEKIMHLTEKHNLDRWCLYEFASFLRDQNRYREAIAVAEKIKRYYDNPDNTLSEYCEAMLLNLLALLYSDTQRHGESEKYYLLAVEIRERLSKANPEAFESNLAKSYNNLALLYSHTQRYGESEKYHLLAVEIMERLSKADPEAFEPDLAKSYNNLATLYKNTQRYGESEKYHLLAVEIRERLSKADPEAFEPDLAKSYDNLAILYKNTQRYGEAEKYYLLAVEIRERLSKANPEAFEPNLAGSYNNLANLYSDTQRYGESEKYHLLAIEIRERLSKANPDAFEPDLATSYNNLANLYSHTQRYGEAEKYYLLAVEIMERLSKANPDAFEPNLAMSYWNLGIFYENRGDNKKALDYYTKSREIYIRLDEKNPGLYSEKAQTLNQWIARLNAEPTKKGLFARLFGKK